MSDKNMDASCTIEKNYKCYGAGLSEMRGDNQGFTPSRARDGEPEIYRIKEPGIPSTGFKHPPIVRPPPAFVGPLEVSLPNQFTNNLYLKYPFVIPKGIKPEQCDLVGQRSYTCDYTDLTTYQESYGNKGFPEPPELIEAKGLGLPEPARPPYRLPGVPYMSLCRRPLPQNNAVDLKTKRERKKEAQNILRKLPQLPRRVSEYEDNYNTLVRYWKKNGLYTDPCFFIPHKPTLPK